MEMLICPSQTISREQLTPLPTDERHILIMTHFHFDIDQLIEQSFLLLNLWSWLSISFVPNTASTGAFLSSESTIRLIPVGLYLAITDGHRVNVYNYEGQNERKGWNFDAKVNDMAFSNDNDEFMKASSLIPPLSTVMVSLSSESRRL